MYLHRRAGLALPFGWRGSEGVEGEGGTVDFLFVGGGGQGGEFVRPVVDGLALVGVGAEIFGVEEQLARQRGGAVFIVRHFAEQGSVRIEQARAHGDMPRFVFDSRAFADEPACAVDEEVCAVFHRQHFAVDGAGAQNGDFYFHYPGDGGAREVQLGVFLRALRQLFIQAGVEVIAQDLQACQLLGVGGRVIKILQRHRGQIDDARAAHIVVPILHADLVPIGDKRYTFIRVFLIMLDKARLRQLPVIRGDTGDTQQTEPRKY